MATRSKDGIFSLTMCFLSNTKHRILSKQEVFAMTDVVPLSPLQETWSSCTAELLPCFMGYSESMECSSSRNDRPLPCKAGNPIKKGWGARQELKPWRAEGHDSRAPFWWSAYDTRCWWLMTESKNANSLLS